MGIQHRRRTNKMPFAKIDWEKARELFNHPENRKLPTAALLSSQKLITALARVGESGLLFLFNPDNPYIVDYIYGERQLPRWRVNHLITRFKKQRYVHIREENSGNMRVTITDRGRVRALAYALDTMKLKHQKRWDGKWRVVIFDIPEKVKRVRDIFRMRLQQLELYCVQESVYVSPYPCFDEVEFLRELYGVAFTVRYLLVEKIEDDNALQVHFHLA